MNKDFPKLLFVKPEQKPVIRLQSTGKKNNFSTMLLIKLLVTRNERFPQRQKVT